MPSNHKVGALGGIIDLPVGFEFWFWDCCKHQIPLASTFGDLEAISAFALASLTLATKATKIDIAFLFWRMAEIHSLTHAIGKLRE